MFDILHPETQSRARLLEPDEIAFGDALMAIFSDTHDFDKVVERLNSGGVAPPSGARLPWSTKILAEELATINASLDEAYRGDLPSTIEIF